MINATTIRVGDRVRWVICGVTMQGKVANISLHSNSKGNLEPQLAIEYTHNDKPVRTLLQATTKHLKTMKFEVVYS